MLNLRISRILDLRLSILCLLIAADISLGLRDVRVLIPAAVKKGDTVKLICNYDMENDTLYSVKWYKGKREFYRFTPNESLVMKTFPVMGIQVQRNASNASQVVIENVETNMSGRFSCEVSADAPSFHTSIVSGDMEIVEIPETKPTIDGLLNKYRPGDVVRVNCSSEFSKPAANLTWVINDIPALPTQLLSPIKITRNDSNLESTVLGINFLITNLHFIRGMMKLKCIAKIHEIYRQSTESVIEEDRPKILATSLSNGQGSNMYHNLVYDNQLNSKHFKSMLPISPDQRKIQLYVRICWTTFYICTTCTILLFSLRVGISRLSS